MSSTRPRLDAAAAALADYGPVDQTLGISGSLAREWTGAARSTLYRRWPTVTDLNHEVADHVDSTDGWVESLIDRSAGADPITALTQVLAAEGPGARTMVRAAAAGWAGTNGARRSIAARERLRLRWLGAWAEEWASGEGRVFAQPGAREAAAICTAAMVEGHLVLRSFLRHAAEPHEDLERVDLVAATVGDALRELSEPAGTRRQPEPDRLPLAARASAEAPDLVRRCGAGLVAELEAGGAALRPGRLVDLERLARHERVTDRRLYQLWPDSRHLNRDLVVLVGGRFRASLMAAVTDAFQSGLTGTDDFDHAFRSGFDQVVRAGAEGWPGQPPIFWLYRSLLDPHLRADALLDQLRWEASAGALVVAGQALAGHTPAGAPVGSTGLTRLTEAVVGLVRLATLDPEVTQLAVEVEGRPVGVAGLICVLVSGSLGASTRAEHPMADLRDVG